MKTVPTTRAARHAIITEIITSSHISSQEELRRALSARGVDVTQATLSRDLDDLRAAKVRLPEGRQEYVLPNQEVMPDLAVAAREYLERWCKDLLLSAQVAFHQIVVRTPPGAAQILASSIDRAVLDGVLGCIAGDDTVLIITESNDRAQRLADHILTLAEHRKEERDDV